MFLNVQLPLVNVLRGQQLLPVGLVQPVVVLLLHAEALLRIGVNYTRVFQTFRLFFVYRLESFLVDLYWVLFKHGVRMLGAMMTI